MFVVAPVAVAKPDAARALGMSIDSFERYVMADVRCIRRGRLRLFPVAELRSWDDVEGEIDVKSDAGRRVVPRQLPHRRRPEPQAGPDLHRPLRRPHTYNIYGHLMPGDEREAAARLDAFLERGDPAREAGGIVRTLRGAGHPVDAD